MTNRRHFLQSLGSAALTALAPGGLAQALSLPRTDVTVIGAGLSGLYAAMLLEEKGLTVRVIEGGQRIGGRLYTLDDLPGRPNTGGTEVGNGYKRLVTLAGRLGVDLVEPISEGRGQTQQYVIDGQTVLAKDWPTSPLNRLADAEKKTLPHLLEFTALQGKNPFETLDDWYNPRFANLDIPFSGFLRKYGASAEAIRLIDANANTNDISSTSTLQLFKNAVVRTKGGSTKTLRIKDGSQRLPEAMAKALKSAPLLGHSVTKIEDKGSFVRVSCANGEQFESRMVVVSCPFAALRRVTIKANLSPIIREAIAELPYTQITQVHLVVKRPFWEDDQLPASIWTDGGAASRPIGRFFTDKGSNATTALCWLNGTEAIAADKLSGKELSSLTLAELKRIRPASEGAIEVAKINSWGLNSMAGGAYYHLAPGQASRFFPAITGTPTQQQNRDAGRSNRIAGRLYFCGEHLALQATGMEGALESGERVAQSILIQ